MKYSLSFFLFLLIFSCKNDQIKKTSNEFEKTDWQKLKLHGKVKAIKETKFLGVENFSEIINNSKSKYLNNKELLFNLDGFKMESNEYTIDGTLISRIMFLHKNNILVEYNEYDAQGLLFGTGKYKVGEEGHPEKLNYKTKDGRYRWSETYTYQDGNLSEISHYNGQGILESLEKNIYQNKNLIESELYYDNNLVSKNRYSFDEDGSLIKLKYSGDNTTYTYTYNYDVKGNWIKKIIFENNKPNGILIRDIEYFN